MFRVLVVGSHVLYFKTLIPSAYAALAVGCKVEVIVDSYRELAKDKEYIEKNPTRANKVSVNRLVGISEEYVLRDKWQSICTDAVVREGSTYNHVLFGNYDLVICITKDAKWVKALKRRRAMVLVVPYEQIQLCMIDVGAEKRLRHVMEDLSQASQPYIDIVEEYGISFCMRHEIFGLMKSFQGYVHCGFPHLEMYQHCDHARKSSNRILILDSGGGRGVGLGDNYSELTEPIQRILDAGFSVDIKTHPVPTVSHSYEGLVKWVAEEYSETENRVRVLKTRESYLRHIRTYDAVFCYGSSAVYEMWSIGYFDTYTIGYYGDSRASAFDCTGDRLLKDKDSFNKAVDRLSEQKGEGAPTRCMRGFYNVAKSRDSIQLISEIITVLRRHS